MGKYEKNIIAFGTFIIKHWLTVVNVMLFLFIVPSILLYPYFMSTGNPTLATIAQLIKGVYGPPVCHQLPERSLFIFGYQMALCSRCFAIYVSFLAGGLLFYLLRDRLKPFHIGYYILFCIPMAIDGFSQLFGVPIPRGVGPGMELLWTQLSNNELRILTGALFGLGSALFVLPYMQQVFEMAEEAPKEQKTIASTDAPQEG